MKYETQFRTQKIHPTVTGDRPMLAAKAGATNDSFALTNTGAVGRTSMSPIIAKNEQEISTLVENETRRLEKLALLQQKEWMRLLAFEAKSKELMVCKQHPTDIGIRTYFFDFILNLSPNLSIPLGGKPCQSKGGSLKGGAEEKGETKA
jgi:hypothetical protein